MKKLPIGAWRIPSFRSLIDNVPIEIVSAQHSRRIQFFSPQFD